MVTKMMAKHSTQLLSTTKGDLRPQLANLKSKYAKLKFFFQPVMTFSLFEITLLIIRVWVTNGAQTANGIFQTSNDSTYISLP